MNYFENKKILAPCDFSTFSENAVETAIKIAGNCKNVTVLHIVDPTPIYSYHSAGDIELGGDFDTGISEVDNTEAIDDEHEQRALGILQREFSDASFAGLNFATAVDDAPHGIANFASHHKFDLIVLPSHGRTGVKRLFIGSTAERVVRLAHCPVMVLRS